MCDKRKMSNWTVTERDLEIFNRWQSGDSVRMIAMDEYVSTQRIYEIITKVRLFRGEEVYKDRSKETSFIKSSSPLSLQAASITVSSICLYRQILFLIVSLNK